MNSVWNLTVLLVQGQELEALCIFQYQTHPEDEFSLDNRLDISLPYS